MIYYFSSFLSFPVWSEENDKDFTNLNQIFKQNFLDKVEKIFSDNVIPSFKDRDQIFNNDSFFDGAGPDISWKEKKGEIVLIIGGSPMENQPFDINIKNGSIMVKGAIETVHENQTPYGNSIQRAVSQFQQSFSIPKGVDINKMRIENKEEEIWVVFPKLIGQNDSKSKNTTKSSEKRLPIKTPVKPSKDDLKI